MTTRTEDPAPAADTARKDAARTDGVPVDTVQIGTVAERTGLSLRTLRHWDEVGLVSPSARSEGGFRLYTESDVERILLVRRMKPLGFTLEQMGELLALAEGEPTEASRAHLAALRTEAHERRAQLARKLDMADEFIATLDAL
ncbi:MerR family transcriptional regulator [Brevibacterium litoralis]|uniref:helix-turn-helix domain-containing protein n=1 Tax=Brevibacterium litoralis TaxID=3138935 RepID=UPI0032EF942A